MKAILIFVLLVGAGACSPGDKPKEDAAPLRAWLWYLPDTLDTYRADQFSLLPLAKNIYAPLVSTYMDGAVQGMIAESWTVSPDGLTWKFLPRGVSFQDGTPVTAPAIVSNFRRILWLTRGERMALNALLPELKTWKSYDAPLKSLYEEKGEVVFVFAKRPKNLFEAISQPIYGIADPKCFGPKGEWKDPFCAGGSGEYSITGRTPDTITIKARHLYQRAEKAPEIVELAVPTAANPSSVKSMIEGSGDLAIKTSLEVDSELLEMVRPAGIMPRNLPAFQMNFAVLNPFKPPFSDPELRKSFRDALHARLRSDPLFSPNTEVDPSFIPKGAIGYIGLPVSGNKALKTHAGEKVTVFLGKKAKNLIKKKRVYGDIVRQAVIDALEEHGFKLEIVDPPPGEYWARMRKGDYDVLLYSSVVSVENPFESLRTLFMREKLEGLPVTSGRIGSLIEAAEASSDPAERRGLAEKINRAIFDDAAVVTYAHSGLIYLFKPGVDLSRCSMFLSPMEFRAVNWTPGVKLR